MKTKRLSDRDFLDFVKTLPCICCAPGKQQTETDPHHITTVKAGGGDHASNVMPLCRTHHTEYHKSGIGRMIEKYPSVKSWLISAERNDVIERSKRGQHE